MLYKLIILFFIYSFLGWVMEIILTLIVEKKLINRGFLIGPYCPIYGVGSLLLVFFLREYQDNLLVLFVLTMFICSILEYVTSYLLEKIFKLRWWDYTNMKFNINGRICLETMVPFGIFGVLAIRYITPFLLMYLNSVNKDLVMVSAICLTSIFIVDVIISSNVVFNLKNVTKNLTKDSTEEIKKAVLKFIHDNKSMYMRVIKAFPNITKTIKDKTRKMMDRGNKK